MFSPPLDVLASASPIRIEFNSSSTATTSSDATHTVHRESSQPITNPFSLLKHPADPCLVKNTYPMRSTNRCPSTSPRRKNTSYNAKSLCYAFHCQRWINLSILPQKSPGKARGSERLVHRCSHITAIRMRTTLASARSSPVARSRRIPPVDLALPCRRFPFGNNSSHQRKPKHQQQRFSIRTSLADRCPSNSPLCKRNRPPTSTIMNP